MATPTAAQLIATAKKEIGVHESPAGSNIVKYNKLQSGWQGVAWCAAYVSWCFAQYKVLPIIGGADNYTVTMGQWFYNHNQWGMVPKIGAIVFFNFGNPYYGDRWKGIHHVGIVIGRTSDGRLITIEGNTSLTSNANGGEVQIRYRAMSSVAGFGYPKYAAAIPAPPVVMYTVPKVTDMSGKTAVTYLANHGFYATVKTTNNPAVKQYIISSQAPAAGVKTPKGSYVTIVESTGHK